MIYYKIDVLEELKARGITPAKIRKENIISQASLQNIRQQKPVNFATLATLCELLKLQPGSIIGYRSDRES